MSEASSRTQVSLARLNLNEREHARAPVRVPLRLRLDSVDDAVASEAVNISRSGMFLAMPTPLAVGSGIDVEITVGKAEALVLHASVEVVRQQFVPPVGIGVRFVDVSFEAQVLIDRLLADQRALSGYHLERLIGCGGMAEVYRAKAIRGPYAGTTVALKRILPELVTSAEVVELFRRECEIGRLLSHPNIVELYEAGAIGESCFLAMELVEGHDLRDVLCACNARGVLLPVDFACFLAHAVAEALDFAHCAVDPAGVPYGFVHRDVSPSNVFISRQGEIKLGDFGVAQIRTAAAEQRRLIVGKNHYIAPELRRGEPATPATDVFALTAVFYELLTNRVAFAGKDPDEIKAMIGAGALEPPSRLRPDLPSAVDAVVMRGLSPLVEGMSSSERRRASAPAGAPARFASARGLADALRPLFDDGVGNALSIAAIMRHLFDGK